MIFYQRMQFHNCIGTVDGKHNQIKMPTGSGSLFYNYKCFLNCTLGFSSANYCFITVGVGTGGQSSYSNIFKNSNIGRKLESNQMGIPGSRLLPNDDNGQCMPFVIRFLPC